MHCVIDNGGMYIYTGKLSIVRLKFFKECDLCSPPFVSLSASAGYFLSDLMIDSSSLKQQLEQESHRFTYEADPSPPLSPTVHQIISLLAARGHWVTSQPALQLDPPEAQLLYLKGASLHFMFPPVWTLSAAQLGSYLGVLEQVLRHMEEGVIK